MLGKDLTSFISELLPSQGSFQEKLQHARTLPSLTYSVFTSKALAKVSPVSKPRLGLGGNAQAINTKSIVQRKHQFTSQLQGIDAFFRGFTFNGH